MIPADLLKGKYILIESFRKNGIVVKTPVWYIVINNVIYVRSDINSGKVKRIKNNSSIRVGTCNIFGKPIGSKHLAKASIVDHYNEFINSQIDKKYGLVSRLLRIYYKTKGIHPCLISINPSEV